MLRLPSTEPTFSLSQTDELAVNLLWRALLTAHHSNSLFCYIHRQCLDSSALPLMSERSTPFPAEKAAGGHFLLRQNEFIIPKASIWSIFLSLNIYFKSGGINVPRSCISNLNVHTLTFLHLSDSNAEWLTVGRKPSLCRGLITNSWTSLQQNHHT